MSALHHDYLVYVHEHELENFPKFKRLIWLLAKTTFPIVLFYRLSQHKNILVRYISIPIYKIVRILTGVQIPRSSIIGKGLFLPHYGTIVLNRNGVYGDNLTVYHGVTVGAKGGASDETKNPVIGNHVRLSAGAIILGDVSIGDNVTIGAGSVVVKDVPSDTVVVGGSAKPIT